MNVDVFSELAYKLAQCSRLFVRLDDLHCLRQ